MKTHEQIENGKLLRERLNYHCNRAIARGDGPIVEIPAIRHTPGPWFCTKNDPRLCIKGTEQLHCVSKRREEFADIVHETVAENISEHDAQLISAAPDLLSAIKGVLYSAEAMKESLDGIEGYSGEPSSFKQARAAIAKAEGRVME